ncbi:hypothetical protein CHU98_g8625 [Xylaria longipes]|nr:hypothetical protein CHU98_g8625 [Xylaria longipes]
MHTNFFKTIGNYVAYKYGVQTPIIRVQIWELPRRVRTTQPQAREADQNAKVGLPLFRLRHTFEDGLVFIGDTFGDHTWIDASHPRCCPPECACYRLNTAPEEASFAFTVDKNADALQVRIHSAGLRVEVLKIMGSLSVDSIMDFIVGKRYDGLDGFALLRLRPRLLKTLKYLRCNCRTPDRRRLISEMSLLVNGLLDDVEVFQDFGLQNLYDQGRISHAQWELFSNAHLMWQIENALPLGTSFEHQQPLSLSAPSEHQDYSGHPHNLMHWNEGGTSLDHKNIGNIVENYSNEVHQNEIEDGLWTDSDAEYLHFHESSRMKDTISHRQTILYPTAQETASSLNVTVDSDSVALSMAAHTGNEQVVVELLGKGVDPDGLNLPSYLGSALFEAVCSGHEKIAQILIDNGASVGGTSVEGWTSRSYRPLLGAINRRSISMIELLLNNCISVELCSADIISNCNSSDRWLIAKLLLDCGVGVSFLETELKKLTDPDVRLLAVILLLEAAERESIEDVRQAIAAGGDPSLGLPTALGRQNLHLVRLLLAEGADPRYLSIGGNLIDDVGEESVSKMLAQAVHWNDKQLLELLLDRGGDANSIEPTTQESILIEAIRAGNESCVSHLLLRGALVKETGPQGTMPLAEAVKMQRSSIKRSIITDKTLHDDIVDVRANSDAVIKARMRIRECLDCSSFAEHATPEESLYQASRIGDATAVQNLLQSASEAPGISHPIPQQILNLDVLHVGGTCLMEAVRQGHLRIAKLLLQYGADVNVMSSNETALSIVAKSGSESLFLLLLQNGADLHVAALMLRIDPHKLAGPSAINRLNSMTKRYQDDLEQSLNHRKEIKELQYAFLREHMCMKRVATFSCMLGMQHKTDVYDLAINIDRSKRWAYSLEMDTRRAWLIARTTLQQLCRRVLPRDLNETLLFLALARSMSAVTENTNNSPGLSEFKEDVTRWQMLFSAEDGGQRAFRDAVKDIWGIDVSESRPSPLPTAHELEKFQELAVNLVRRTAYMIGSDTIEHAGLHPITARWRRRQPEKPPQSMFELGPNIPKQTEVVEGNYLNDGLAHETSEDFLDPGGHEKPPDSIPDFAFTKRTDMLLIILMAGAIFAIVIDFLLVTGDSVSNDGPFEGNGVERILLTVQQQVTKIAATALFALAAPSGDSTISRFAREKVAAVRKHTDVAIESGHISSLDQLQGFLASDIEAKFTGLGTLLATRCTERKYINTMQYTYSVLQAYLGFKVTGLPLEVQRKSYTPETGGATTPGDVSSFLEADRPAKRLKASPQGFSSESPNSTASFGSPSSTFKHCSVPSVKKTFCDECQRDYKTTSNYGKHRQGPRHKNRRYHCTYGCGADFLQNETRLRHERKKHQGIMSIKPRLPSQRQQAISPGQPYA